MGGCLCSCPAKTASQQQWGETELPPFPPLQPTQLLGDIPVMPSPFTAAAVVHGDAFTARAVVTSG